MSLSVELWHKLCKRFHGWMKDGEAKNSEELKGLAMNLSYNLTSNLHEKFMPSCIPGVCSLLLPFVPDFRYWIALRIKLKNSIFIVDIKNDAPKYAFLRSISNIGWERTALEYPGF
jgi:hypothetical protein